MRDDSTHRPVAGAIVRLLDPSGTVVAQVLASEVGRAVLKAPQPGAYRVRADAIAFRGTLSPLTTLADGATVPLGLEIHLEPPMLEELVVTGENRCVSAPAGGTLPAVLWEEIRKALTAERITREAELETLAVTLFERELSRTGTVYRQRTIASLLTSGRAFRTISPEELAEHGFVRVEADSESYAGPDAVLMLSDAFVQTHCFRPGPRDPEGLLIGLAFEPVRDRGVPDIAGVVWMDRRSRELRYIEYQYTGLRSVAANSKAGGRVDYARLADGTWIVSDWFIRMPRIGRLVSMSEQHTARETRIWGRADRDTLLGYVDRGGHAVPRGTQAPPPAVLSGVVFDSLTGHGLAGAQVNVAGGEATAVTDSGGAFRVEVGEPGQKFVMITHPRLGVVADQSSQEVTLRSGEETRITAAVPALAAFSRVFCRDDAGEAGLIGIVFDAAGFPAEGVRVRASWLARATRGKAVFESLSTLSVSRGVYSLCDLPVGPTLTLQLLRGTKVVHEEQLPLETRGFRWLELRATNP